MASKDLTVKNEEVLTMRAYLEQPNIKIYIRELLKEKAGAWETSMITLWQGDQRLQKCKKLSVVMCGLKAAALNLPLENNLGYAYAIPYGEEATFQLGYKAFVQLAMRTGLFVKLNVIEVKEGELLSWEPLSELIEYKALDNRESIATIGFCAYFKLTNGFEKVIFRKKEELLAHGKRFSKAYLKKDAPWQTDTDAMCRKTLLKELLSKWAPLSADVIAGIKADQAVIRPTETGEVYEYPDAGHEEEAPTYDIPAHALAELHSYFDTLGINEAERAMRLGACKGDPEAIQTLACSLRDEINMEGTQPKDVGGLYETA
jgi:recombination protein RecT